MSLTVLLTVEAADRAPWRAALLAGAAALGLPMTLHDDPAAVDPATVDCLVFAHAGPVQDFRPYVRLRAILSIWAGVEKALAMPGLPEGVPLTRMVEPGLVWGMRDYVVGHVMRRHLDLDAALAGPGPVWGEPVPPLARDRTVGVLGLGALGGVAARALAALDFRVLGWSRTAKAIPGVDCRTGPEGLCAVLAAAEILVCLLPATPATEGLLDAAALALLPCGASLINAGRGALIDDAALLAALDAGRLANATLDVFRVEPLPADHPFRRHARVTVTPHVASATRPETAAPEILAQIARLARGEPLIHVVDRRRGY